MNKEETIHPKRPDGMILRQSDIVREPEKKAFWQSVDFAKADGISIGILFYAALFIVSRHVIENKLLWVSVFALCGILSYAYILFPYAAKIETRLFGLKNCYLRRPLVIAVKLSSWIFAVFFGLGMLSYWM